MKHKNERTAWGHTLGRFFYRLLEGNRSKISEKTRENARKPSKMQKNQHDNSIKIIVLIWSK